MTDLSKKVSRTCTKAAAVPRPLIISLEPPNIITLREKGRKMEVSITADSLYILLVERAVDKKPEPTKPVKRTVERGLLQFSRKAKK